MKSATQLSFKFEIIINSKSDVSVKCVKSQNMYILNLDSNNKDHISNYLSVSTTYTYSWHLRLGHENKNKMIRMHKSGLILQINLNDFDIYESCIKSKLSSKSFFKN